MTGSTFRARLARAMRIRDALVLGVLGLGLLTGASAALGADERPEPEVHGTYHGDPMYTVLPPDAIPAIDAPEFLSGTEADAQMQDDEPVLGLQIGGDVRAYSLWQLDAHEIVNDTVGRVPLAATW